MRAQTANALRELLSGWFMQTNVMLPAVDAGSGPTSGAST
jgi:hypothetical protein